MMTLMMVMIRKVSPIKPQTVTPKPRKNTGKHSQPEPGRKRKPQKSAVYGAFFCLRFRAKVREGSHNLVVEDGSLGDSGVLWRWVTPMAARKGARSLWQGGGATLV